MQLDTNFPNLKWINEQQIYKTQKDFIIIFWRRTWNLSEVSQEWEGTLKFPLYLETERDPTEITWVTLVLLLTCITAMTEYRCSQRSVIVHKLYSVNNIQVICNPNNQEYFNMSLKST